MVSDLGDVGLCFSQNYFYFIINTRSFINLNWFPERILVPGTFLSVEDSAGNKDGDIFFKIRSIDQSM